MAAHLELPFATASLSTSTHVLPYTPPEVAVLCKCDLKFKIIGGPEAALVIVLDHRQEKT